ncbi:MAG: hypothetical protein R2792_00620 [Saprospiraceae bacterium]
MATFMFNLTSTTNGNPIFRMFPDVRLPLDGVITFVVNPDPDVEPIADQELCTVV